MDLDFVTATTRYEDWLRSQVDVIEKELRYKHRKMASGTNAFPFFRGTYYRWAQIWPLICQDCEAAPTVLSIGDLHVENFGTWRDHDGRLVWGINDFDEADDLPFTNDLVRLATSAVLGAATGQFGLSLKAICRAILSGYTSALKTGGQPFVLEENHLELRALAMQADREPIKFWKGLGKDLSVHEPDLSGAMKEKLLKDLPGASANCRFSAREKAGMGSLGKPRYVALATFNGSLVAREAKALTPPSTASLEEKNQKKSRIADVLGNAVRCADPIYRVDDSWIIRRLAPRCSRIELKQLDCVSEKLMFESMGAETANIHLGTPTASKPILKWLGTQERGWLEKAAMKMSDATRDDWRLWRKHQKTY
jgi:hypothetical protein